MEKITLYKIPIVALKNKVHYFEYKLDGEFFKSFDNNTINECNIEVKVELEKRDSIIILLFMIDGTINLICDRCLDVYPQNVFGDYKLIIQFGNKLNQDNDNDDDILLMPRNSDFIEISKPIYDYTLLSLPFKHVHSEAKDCNQKMIAIINKSLENNNKKEIDPRWEILNKLKNK